MKAFRKAGLSIFIALGAMLAPAATQAGAVTFSPSAGEYFIDTTTLQLSGPGGAIATGVDQGGIAVFAFDSINIPPGAEIFAEGSRPLELRSAGAFAIGGLIEASGFSAETGEAGPNPGGPGGGAGGADGTQGGFGPGGGGAGATGFDGGGGGGFGGRGAAGGTEPSEGVAGGLPGSAYGDLNVSLQGGSGGAGSTIGGSAAGGGGGGGGVKLTATTLTVSAAGEVRADGGDGNGAGNGASGGGSGGGILLRADTIDVAGVLSAEGGDGGTGGCCGDGGGGGGGRIAYQYRTLANPGIANVAGGVSGLSGPYGFGDLSPDPTGAPGVITKVQAPSATTAAATAITPTSATLNGSVNPNGSATAFSFQLGTTTAYGTTIPLPAASVGSDTSDHALSAIASGLAPGTTYHYRIVATNQVGFETAGADMTFTTAPSFTGVKIPRKAKVKKGKALVKLLSQVASQGKLVLFGPKAGKTGKASAKGRKGPKLGSASFSLAAGKAKIVRVPLKARALKLLKKGKVKATAVVTATDQFGVKRTTQRKIVLVPAKKRR